MTKILSLIFRAYFAGENVHKYYISFATHKKILSTANFRRCYFSKDAIHFFGTRFATDGGKGKGGQRFFVTGFDLLRTFFFFFLIFHCCYLDVGEVTSEKNYHKKCQIIEIYHITE